MGFVHGVLRTAFQGGYCAVCTCAKTFMCGCEQFCALKYVLVDHVVLYILPFDELSVGGCVVCLCVVLSVLYMLRTAFQAGYVRGVSVCDCARVLALGCLMEGAVCTCAKTFMCIVSSFVCLEVCAIGLDPVVLYILPFDELSVGGCVVCLCVVLSVLYMTCALRAVM
ncbi:Serine-Protein Kinase Atm [Manis pentadactyla]|nr:Serine-Protein Kinase Atm [Manis pentadactyla]